ncbi:MAG: hypothetical protein LUQ12_00650 [Methanoregulaceae archaeon]|nr:hypothetical protein [Methanoregulaceae archaeon]
MDLQNLVECSPDSPVKKDLLRNAGSNIVLVCLKTGQVIPPHPEPYAVVFVVLQAEGIITAETSEHPIQPIHFVSVQKDKEKGIQCHPRMVILGIRDDV